MYPCSTSFYKMYISHTVKNKIYYQYSEYFLLGYNNRWTAEEYCVKARSDILILFERDYLYEYLMMQKINHIVDILIKTFYKLNTFTDYLLQYYLVLKIFLVTCDNSRD